MQKFRERIAPLFASLLKITANHDSLPAAESDHDDRLKNTTAQAGARLADPIVKTRVAADGTRLETLMPEPIADPVVVARLCHDAGQPDLIASLLQGKLTMSQVQARVEEAAEIRKTAVLLGLPNMAASLVASGATIEIARTLLNEAKLAQEQAAPTDNVAAGFQGEPLPASGRDAAISKVNQSLGYTQPTDRS